MRDCPVRFVREKCDLCGTCVGVCPVDAIILWENGLEIDSEVCIRCMKCVWVCPCGAFWRSDVER